MSSQAVVGKPRDSRTVPVVRALVDEGLLDASRAEAATGVVDRVLAGQLAAGTTLRHRLSELAGYVGGAFVVSAAVLFLADQWDTLSTGARVGLLGGIAGLLAVAGGMLGRSGGGFAGLRAGAQPVRRRLAGVLFAGAAGAAAAAVGVLVDARVADFQSQPVLAGSLTVLALGGVGYLLAPTVLGQLVLAGGLVMAVPSFLDVIGDVEPVPFGLAVLVAGLIWLGLAERRVWRELLSARVIGCALTVVGAQVPVGSDQAWVGYVATAAVAAAGFALYVAERSWPYLAAGVVGLTLVVPEALLDWTEGSLGTAGVLLVAGVTLLGASLLGLRLRKEGR